MDPSALGAIIATQAVEMAAAALRQLSLLPAMYELATSSELRDEIRRRDRATRHQLELLEPVLSKVGIRCEDVESGAWVNILAESKARAENVRNVADVAVAASLIRSARRDLESRMFLMDCARVYDQGQGSGAWSELLEEPIRSAAEELQELESKYGAILGDLPGDPVIRPWRPAPQPPDPNDPKPNPQSPGQPGRATPGPTIEPRRTAPEIE
jgi:hypothetical protein